MLDRFSQTIKTRHSLVSEKKDRDTGHGYSNSYKVALTTYYPLFNIIVLNIAVLF